MQELPRLNKKIISVSTLNDIDEEKNIGMVPRPKKGLKL